MNQSKNLVCLSNARSPKYLADYNRVARDNNDQAEMANFSMFLYPGSFTQSSAENANELSWKQFRI